MEGTGNMIIKDVVWQMCVPSENNTNVGGVYGTHSDPARI